MKKINPSFVVITISAILLFIPFFVWGNNYLVGGDDTRLYYIFPLDFIKNYAVNIASDNTLAGAMTGYASVAYYIPFFVFVFILKQIPVINTQMLMYGLNLALGFLAFYKLIGLYINQKDDNEKLISILGTLFYLFSTYIVKTHFNNQMISMYLVSLLPACLSLFIFSVRKKRFVYTAISVLLFSIFSTTLNTLPWWGGFAVTSIPLLVYELLQNKKTFIFYGIFGFTMFLLLNSYWIFHYIYPLFVNQGIDSASQIYNSQKFVEDNLRIVMGVSTLLKPINIIANKMEYNPAILHITVVDFIPFFIVLAGIVLSVKAKMKEKLLFNLILSGFLLSWFLFSPNLGEWGPKLFLYLSVHIPYFTMFRNMYDKFSISLAMYFAFLVVLSIVLLYRKSRRLLKYTFILLATYLVFISIPQFINVSLNTKETYSLFNGRFNYDFKELVDYFKTSEDHSKILWLPLNSPTYLNISGSDEGEFYSGLSPIGILTGKTDYTGRFSFIVGNDFFLGDEVFKMLKNRDYEAFGKLLKKLNISYIVYSNEEIPTNIQSYQYGGDTLPVLKMQGNEEFKSEILGEHIKDFGSRYELYRINPKYESFKFYLENEGFAKPLEYKKIDSEKYLIDAGEYSNGNIVFSELNSNYWNMSKNGIAVDKKDSDLYTNVWSIIGDISNQNLLLEFKPKQYSSIFYILSASTGLFLVIYIGIYFIKKGNTV